MTIVVDAPFPHPDDSPTTAQLLQLFRRGDKPMLYYALVFLVVGLIAGALGVSGVAAVATQIAYVLFVIAIVLFVLHLLTGRSRPVV
jgi:uncharacterized membrane protein YtjA (UPF0391 family)